MKQITIISFILIILLQFTSCKRVPLSTGEMTTEVRQLEHFSKLKLFNNVNVTIMPCDTFMIEISAGKNLIKNITSEVNNDTLIIKNNNARHKKRNRLQSEKIAAEDLSSRYAKEADLKISFGSASRHAGMCPAAAAGSENNDRTYVAVIALILILHALNEIHCPRLIYPSIMYS